MDVRRGDLIVVVVAGDYGKPRPALVVQNEAFRGLPSLTVLPLSSQIHDEHLLRVTVEPDASNGLKRPSQVMVDKIATIPKTRIGQRIGRLDEGTMAMIETALRRFLDLT